MDKNSLCIKQIQTLFTIPEIRDEILSCLSAKECIIVSVIVGFSPLEIDRINHYKRTYIEDGIEVDIYDELTISHNLENIWIAITKWIKNMRNDMYHDYCNAYITWRNVQNTKVISIKVTIYERYMEINIHKLNTDSTSFASPFIMTYDICFCTKHTVAGKLCIQYSVDTLYCILQKLYNFNDYDILEYSTTLYNCRPTVPIEIYSVN